MNFRRKMPPYVRGVFEYISKHDDWFCDGYTIERPGGTFDVWVANGAWFCVPRVRGFDRPFPLRYRRRLLKAANAALDRSMHAASALARAGEGER